MSHLIFDAQVFQTPALQRGMGKYSFELIRSMALRNVVSEEWTSIDVILSTNMDIDEQNLSQLRALPLVTIYKLDLSPNDILNPDISSTHNRHVIDEFIKDKPAESAYIILSLMQGEISPVYPSLESISKSVLFYDLIPLMFHKIYLQNPITRKEYLSKLKELLLSDIYLAISKTVANDLSVYLGVDTTRIVSIDGGPIAHDTKTKKIDVPKNFILMPTGNDLRKNNNRAIEGFKLFNQKHANKYSLVITSFFKDEQIEELSALAENVIFTGNISGSELNYLYEKAALLLFPSEYEGLGLPVLEALEHGLGVVCSDITVFREISATAFSYFDPTRIHSIADALEEAINKDFEQASAREILNKYTWENTATITEEKLLETKKNLDKKVKDLLTVVGADFSGNNKVGKFILQSHASLNRIFDIRYYELLGVNKVESRVDFLPYVTSWKQLAAHEPIFVDGDSGHVLYHITNTKNSVLPLMGALAKPGVVFLHDSNLHNLWLAAREQGIISSGRFELEEKINAKFDGQRLSWIGSLVAHQKAVVVFSDEAESIVKKIINNMKKRTVALKLAVPSNQLVYPEIISKHKAHIPSEEFDNIDDLHYEVTLSHADEKSRITSNIFSTETLLINAELDKYLTKDTVSYTSFSGDLLDVLRSIEIGEKA